MKCGCGGKIKAGRGCLLYLGSDEHNTDVQHEGMMREMGQGFGTSHDSDTAMMSMHLQANGFKFDDAERILKKPE